MLIDTATSRGFDYVATGHYARIQTDRPSPILLRAADHRKDQSYFLYRLHPQWLHKLLFPLGELHKSEVWDEAGALGLPADELKESQEICFVTQGDYRTFIGNELPAAKKPGLFIDEAGVPLGEHNGIAFYTPGQRRGLGIATGQRLYVQQVNPSTNTVLLGPEESLLKSACTVSDLNLFVPRLAQCETEIQAKVRYATPPMPATLSPGDASTLQIRFHQPQRAISPGQSVVFYDGDVVLGGGIIQPH
jgi:tRNA-specific 2-thiouridylase